MTISMNDTDVLEVIGAAVAGGVMLFMLLGALFIYLLVRPPRRARQAPPPEAVDYEQMLAVMKRMERRLETLERVVAADAAPRQGIPEAGAERPETRRIK